MGQVLGSLPLYNSTLQINNFLKTNNNGKKCLDYKRILIYKLKTITQNILWNSEDLNVNSVFDEIGNY